MFMVDSNVLIDVIEDDPTWADWSASQLAAARNGGLLVINPIIYAEVSIGYTTIEALEAVLPTAVYRREPLPWEAGFLAGKCFIRYRRRGGPRKSPLPDFYIGAHAKVEGLTLLTRDAHRYRTYFSGLRLITP